MKYILYLFFICQSVNSFSCFSLRFNDSAVQLDSVELCKPKRNGNYDISFGRNLSFKENNNQFTLKMINSEIEVLWSDLTLMIDAREAIISGKIQNSKISGNLVLADLKSVIFANVSFVSLRLNYADLRGVDLSSTTWGNQVDVNNAIISNETKLPFSIEEAFRRGMILK